jgi:hypothetical protein
VCIRNASDKKYRLPAGVAQNLLIIRLHHETENGRNSDVM